MPGPTVYNSPSLQEHNVGAVPGYIEEDVMNRLCDMIEALQDYNGIKRYRNKPDMTLKQVIEESNSIYRKGGYDGKNYLHDAYHTNASSDRSVRGGEVLIAGEEYQDSLRAAKLRMKYLEAATPSPDRGIKVRKDLGEITGTIASANITEFIFHTNPDDAKDMLDRTGEYAKAVVHSQCDFFGIPLKLPEKEQNVLYRVSVDGAQVGAYSIRENAFKKAAEYVRGHIVIAAGGGEVLLDEKRAGSGADERIACLEKQNLMLKAQVDALIEERDALRLKIERAKQDLS